MAKPKDKEDLILAAAMEVFLENGFSNASMQEIATVAGVGKGTIYEYFPNKDHLFIEALKFYMLSSFDKLKKLMLSKANFKDKLEGYIDFHLLLMEKDGPKIETIMIKDNLQMKPESKEIFKNFMMDFDEKHVALLSGVWQQGIEEGLIKATINHQFVASLFADMVIKCGLKSSLQNRTAYPQEVLKQELIKLLLEGIGSRA